MNSVDYINLVQKKYNWSDYELAKQMGVPRQSISNHRTGVSTAFSDELALKIADLLDMDPLKVVADMHAVRAKSSNVKKFWSRVGNGVGTTAAMLLLSSSLMMNPTDSIADSESDEGAHSIYYAYIGGMWVSALCYHSPEPIRATCPLNKPAQKKATYEDLLAVPENLVAEILSGELHTHPRPGPRHSLASTLLTTVIAGHFDRTSNDGPGGWWILDEPECHLGSDVVVPDIAGWRQSTMPELPETAHIEICPDWVCEVLSPSTAQIDRVIKREIYAFHGVHDYWLVNPLERMLEAFTLTNGQWVLSAAISDNDKAVVPPFEQMPFDLGRLWA